jgi:hypothetical protein
MKTQDRDGTRVIEGTLAHHQGGATLLRLWWPFLGRLEEEHHRARQGLLSLRQELGDGQHDGRVGIVAAGVHDPGVAAAIRGVALLRDRQRVHVRSYRDRRPRPPPAKDAHHARLRHRVAHLESQLAEPGGDELARAELAVGELRVLVDVPSQVDEPWAYRGHGLGQAVVGRRGREQDGQDEGKQHGARRRF